MIRSVPPPGAQGKRKKGVKAEVARSEPTTDHLTKTRIRDFEARYQRILDDGHAANPFSASPAHAEKNAGACTASTSPSTTTRPNGTFA